jgi:hypothetical protein
MLRFSLALLWVLTAATAQALTPEELAEIADAREAAPSHITANATFMIFRDGRFQTIQKGTNPFTCLVMRDPLGRFEPSCLNREAMASVFLTYEYQTKRLYEGSDMKNVLAEIKARFDEGKLPTAATGALVYMMSARNGTYGKNGERLAVVPPHQMYFMPRIADDTYSLERGKSPYLWQGYPHMSCLIVNVDAPPAAEAQHRH